jgi:xanthine dehydrogenase molybdopterin-binding subunit B
VHLCDLEVDRETGCSRVVRYTAIQDVGKAVHPSFVEGQMQGGAAQGIGWALNEEYVYDAKGRMENPGFLDYRMPVASDLPMIDTVLVEVANPAHPYGVRGVGEVPIVPPLAAVANAMRCQASGPRRCCRRLCVSGVVPAGVAAGRRRRPVLCGGHRQNRRRSRSGASRDTGGVDSVGSMSRA